MFGLTMFDVIKTIMAPVEKIMTGLPGYVTVVLIMQLLWWFGIHGPNVMGGCYRTIHDKDDGAEPRTLPGR